MHIIPNRSVAVLSYGITCANMTFLDLLAADPHRKCIQKEDKEHLDQQLLRWEAEEIRTTEQTRLKYYEGAKNGSLEDVEQLQYILQRTGVLNCFSCGVAKSKLKRCSRCKSAWYCNTDCFSKDWKRHGKHSCKVLTLETIQVRCE